MTRRIYILRQIAWALILVYAVSFVIIWLSFEVGDPAAAIAPNASLEVLQNMREANGWDDPILSHSCAVGCRPRPAGSGQVWALSRKQRTASRPSQTRPPRTRLRFSRSWLDRSASCAPRIEAPPQGRRSTPTRAAGPRGVYATARAGPNLARQSERPRQAERRIPARQRWRASHRPGVLRRWSTSAMALRVPVEVHHWQRFFVP